MNAKALAIMRYQDGINTEHNMKSICRAAVVSGQSAWLAIDIRGLETGKAQIILLLNWNIFRI